MAYPSDFIPELWSEAALATLEEKLIFGALVNRNFEDRVQMHGDVVNTRIAGNFEMNRADNLTNTGVTYQTPTSENVAIKLDQLVDVAFTINDTDLSLSIEDQITLYIDRAVFSLARGIDRALYGAAISSSLANLVGGVGVGTGSKLLIDARNKLNKNLAPTEDRWAFLTPDTESLMLADTNITASSAVSGNMPSSAIREGMLGRLFGFNTVMSQNVPAVYPTTTDTTTGAINNSAGYVAGHNAAMTVDGFTGVVAVVGAYFTVAGDMTPQIVTAKAETAGNTTSITGSAPLARAVVDNAAVTIYNPATVNKAGGYAAGYAGAIELDGFASGKFLQVGQILAFGTGANRHTYTVIRVVSASGTSQSVHLDRPLEAVVGDNDAAYPGPIGQYNLFCNPRGLTMVARPLAGPMSATGVARGIFSQNGLSMRTTLQYNQTNRRHEIVMDLLFGIKVTHSELFAPGLA